MPVVIAIGPGYGSDAGFWYIGSDGKVHKVEGWGGPQMQEVSAAVSVLAAASLVKDNPRVVDQIVDLSQTLLAPHLEYLANVEKIQAV